MTAYDAHDDAEHAAMPPEVAAELEAALAAGAAAEREAERVAMAQAWGGDEWPSEQEIAEFENHQRGNEMSEAAKTAGHTPGPWEAYIADRELVQPGDDFSVVTRTGDDLASVHIGDNLSVYDEAAANARLIAAAPDLLAALKTLAANLGAYVGPDSWDGHIAKAYAAANDAIAKAGGGS